MVKPRQHRIPIMMSDEELTAIDDWRFSNRIATRSDAIRRLSKIALTTDEWIKEAEDHAEALVEVFLTEYAKLLDVDKKYIPPVNNISNAISLLWLDVLSVTRASYSLRSIEDIDEAINDAKYRKMVALEEKLKLLGGNLGTDLEGTK